MILNKHKEVKSDIIAVYLLFHNANHYSSNTVRHIKVYVLEIIKLSMDMKWVTVL